MNCIARARQVLAADPEKGEAAAMCTAYEIGKRAGSFPAIVKGRAFEILMGLNKPSLIRPTNPSLVLLPDGSLETMHWGFRVKIPGATRGRMLEKTVVNAREDKLDGRTWRMAFAQRRCLIPASGYYEWTGAPGSKQAHFFSRPDEGMLWIAGIWTEHPERGNCYAMITTEPNRVAAIVHDRMPAVLREEEIGSFLAGEMRHFKPAEDTLQAEAVASPLSTGAAGGEKPQQGELF